MTNITAAMPATLNKTSIIAAAINQMSLRLVSCGLQSLTPFTVAVVPGRYLYHFGNPKKFPPPRHGGATANLVISVKNISVKILPVLSSSKSHNQKYTVEIQTSYFVFAQ